jgi:SAM-dependent methyltransferase
MTRIDTINRSMMMRRDAIDQYVAASELSPPEAIALQALTGEARDQPILDLGVGGGRTVGPLRAISSDYVGIDYSPRMVAAAKLRHPDARIEQADACDLSAYPADHFQLVVFSCNGIGMVGHADRLRILASVRRVLRPGGAFVFSNHNPHPNTDRFALPALQLAVNPIRSLVRTARFARSAAVRVANRLRNRRHEVRTAEYAIVNSVCHDYGVMLYVIDHAHQEQQLASAGFALEASYDLEGRPATTATRDDSILYIARKHREAR